MNINRVEKFIREYYAVVPLTGAVNLVEIVVPTKTVMRVLKIGNFAAAWGTVYWEFYKDNLPLYPYETIIDQIAFGLERGEVQSIEIHGGHRFRVRAVNPTAGNLRMGISLSYEFEYQE